MNKHISQIRQPFQFDINLLLAHHQNRCKFFWHSELLHILHPNQQHKAIDPFWIYTQSAKNYTGNQHLLQEHYFQPEFFIFKKTNYGYSNRFIELQTMPIWAHQVLNNYWFWRQKKAVNFAKWLYAFPGVKKVYISSSTVLEIAGPYSDLDFSVQANPKQLLIARFWCLAFFKLHNWQYGQQRQKMAQKKRQPIPPPLGDVRTDFGLIYENEEDFYNYFQVEERTFSILHRLWIDCSNNFNSPDLSPNEGIIKVFTDDKIYHFLIRWLKRILWIMTIILYPLISLQIFWYKIRKGNKFPSEFVSRTFCSFYPRSFADEFVKKHPKLFVSRKNIQTHLTQTKKQVF